MNDSELASFNSIKKIIDVDNVLASALFMRGYDTPKKISNVSFAKFKSLLGIDIDSEEIKHLREVYNEIQSRLNDYLNISNNTNNVNNNSRSTLRKSELNSIEKHKHQSKEKIISMNDKKFNYNIFKNGILSHEPIKLFIIFLVPTIFVCFLLFIWVNRYETIKHNLGGSIEVYVKENRLTGNRCTIKEGIIIQLPELRKSKFPDWC